MTDTYRDIPTSDRDGRYLVRCHGALPAVSREFYCVSEDRDGNQYEWTHKMPENGRLTWGRAVKEIASKAHGAPYGGNRIVEIAAS